MVKILIFCIKAFIIIMSLTMFGLMEKFSFENEPVTKSIITISTAVFIVYPLVKFYDEFFKKINK